MDLELPRGRIIQNVSEAELRAVLLEEKAANLVIDENSYMTCSRRRRHAWQYELEYQHGSLEEHYRAADAPISDECVLAAFCKYLKGDPSWKTDFRWEKMWLAEWAKRRRNDQNP